MQHRDFKNNLRLMTVLIYIIFQMPGQLRFFFFRQWKDDLLPGYMPVLFLICVLAYIALEVIEFKKWNYRYKSRTIPLVLFLIRLMLWFSIMAVLDVSPAHFVLGSFYILLIFYSFFAFSIPLSLSFSLVLTAGILVMELLTLDGSRARTPYWIFFSTYKSIIMILFYLFAYFWEKDRVISDENHQLVEDLNRSETHLREYARKVGQTVALEERTRLARDIHDSLGHALTGIQIQLSKAEAYFDLEPDESRQAILEARESAREAMEDIRSSLGMLNQKDLQFTLEDEISPVLSKLKTAGIQLEADFRGRQENYNYSVLITAYRVIQEGITNILKHAESRSVKLAVEFGPEELHIRMEDDGIGFDPDSLTGVEHYGVNGMKDRMELVRGRLEINAAPGRGCILDARLPRNPVSLIGETHG